MRAPARHARESERTLSLQALRVLDTESEESFDRLAKLAANVCDCPIALVTFIVEDRQWCKAKVGYELPEIERDVSFCGHAVVDDGELLVVEDAQHDPRFDDNPLVVAEPAIRFYAGARVHDRMGLPLGTLCVIDRVPRTLTRSQTAALRMLAREVEVQLDMRLQLDEALRAKDEREQLAAFIVHDMRNSLTVLLGGASCLEVDEELSDSARLILRDIHDAGRTLQRMTRNILDVSRAEARGLAAELKRFDPRALFQRIAYGVAAAAKISDHHIEASFDFPSQELQSDPDLLRRIVENLTDNAFKYAPPGTTVRLEAAAANGSLHIRVLDEGPGIPEADRVRIFDPSVRLRAHARTPGWGFGLRSCQLAVEALGGWIDVRANTPRGSVFEVVLPLG